MASVSYLVDDDTHDPIVTNDWSERPSVSKKKLSLKQRRLSRQSQQRLSEEHSFTDDEVKRLIVDNIREEIVKTALDRIYENYLEKQSVYFVCHCTRLAWKALVEWNFQQKDRGGYRDADIDQVDEEPVTSPKDAWAGQSVPIRGAASRTSRFTEMESQTEDVSSIISQPSGAPVRKNTSRVSLEQRVSKPLSKHFRYDKISSKPKKSEDFSTFRTEIKIDKIVRPDEGKKDTYELPTPVPLQSKHFPSARVEVQYAIMPGSPGKGSVLASKNELKTKTIVLKKPTDEDKKNS